MLKLKRGSNSMRASYTSARKSKSNDSFRRESYDEAGVFYNKQFDINSLKFHPSFYVYVTPEILIPTDRWRQEHAKLMESHIRQVEGTINRRMHLLNKQLSVFQDSITDLISTTVKLLNERKARRHRGLKEYRKMFFLIDYSRDLQMKFTSMEMVDIEEEMKYLHAMHSHVETIKSNLNSYISIDLDGYTGRIPNHKDTIRTYKLKNEIIERNTFEPPIIPPPDDLEGQLIYPTSSTYKAFEKFEKEPLIINTNELFNSFKEMTDDNDELALLIEIAYDFAWRQEQYPFSGKPMKLPTFAKVKVKKLNVPFISEAIGELTVSELSVSCWPFLSVQNILTGILFEINPMRMAHIYYDAMLEAGNCIENLEGKSDEIDFDTIFPIMFLCTLSAGLTYEPQILQFITSISNVHIQDSAIQYGCSYAEAILTHMLSLNELDLQEE